MILNPQSNLQNKNKGFLQKNAFSFQNCTFLQIHAFPSNNCKKMQLPKERAHCKKPQEIPGVLKKREGVPEMGTKPLKALRGYWASN